MTALKRIGAPALPASYVSSSQVARKRQRAHFRWVCIELVFIVVAGGLTAVPSDQLSGVPGSTRLLASAFAIAMVLALLARAWRWGFRHEGVWFQARALAESLKREAWLLMMRAGRYSGPSWRTAFAEALAEYQKSNDDLFGALPLRAGTSEGEEITGDMQGNRSAPLAHRRVVYEKYRFMDQVRYYQRRAMDHQKEQRLWTILSIALELTAIGIGVWAMIAGATIGFAGFLTTSAAALLAWTQARDGARLAKSYSLVSHDLRMLRAKHGRPASEAEFQAFVDDVERTLSREHTYWRSRGSAT